MGSLQAHSISTGYCVAWKEPSAARDQIFALYHFVVVVVVYEGNKPRKLIYFVGCYHLLSLLRRLTQYHISEEKQEFHIIKSVELSSYSYAFLYTEYTAKNMLSRGYFLQVFIKIFFVGKPGNIALKSLWSCSSYCLDYAILKVLQTKKRFFAFPTYYIETIFAWDQTSYVSESEVSAISQNFLPAIQEVMTEKLGACEHRNIRP